MNILDEMRKMTNSLETQITLLRESVEESITTNVISASCCHRFFTVLTN